MDFAFVNFTNFTIRYPKQRINTEPFFISQKKNYIHWCNLLGNLQFLFSLDSSLWNKPLEIKEKLKAIKSRVHSQIF